mgnify:CR=1 FL=1
MSKRNSNFTSQVRPYKKLRYQEGNEDDVKFMCSNGVVKVSTSNSLAKFGTVSFAFYIHA